MDMRRSYPMEMMVGNGGGRGSNLPTILYFTFKILSLLIPGGCIYLGYDLFIRGVTGSASLVVNSPDISGQLVNAAPGLFFAFFGLIGLGIAIWKGVDFKM